MWQWIPQLLFEQRSTFLFSVLNLLPSNFNGCSRVLWDREKVLSIHFVLLINKFLNLFDVTFPLNGKAPSPLASFHREYTPLLWSPFFVPFPANLFLRYCDWKFTLSSKSSHPTDTHKSITQMTVLLDRLLIIHVIEFVFFFTAAMH